MNRIYWRNREGEAPPPNANFQIKAFYPDGTSPFNAPFEQLAGATRRILTAELDQSEKKEDRVKACEEYLQRTTEVARRAMNGYKVGQATKADAMQAEYYRLEAEIMLEREKAK